MVPVKCDRFCFPISPSDALRKMMEITLKKLDAQAVEISVSIAPFAEKSVDFKVVKLFRSNPLASN